MELPLSQINYLYNLVAKESKNEADAKREANNQLEDQLLEGG